MFFGDFFLFLALLRYLLGIIFFSRLKQIQEKYWGFFFLIFPLLNSILGEAGCKSSRSRKEGEV